MPEHIHHFTIYDEFLTLSKSDIKEISSLNINNIIRHKGEMKMKWNNPEDVLPEVGAEVAILLYSEKRWPFSAEIYFGTVEEHSEPESLSVANGDDIGAGWIRWSFYHSLFNGRIVGWCDAKYFEKPEFINE